MQSQVKTPLTEEDKVSQTHDMEFNPHYSGEKNMAANDKWISRSWGNVFNSRYYSKTYAREYNALQHRNTPWGKEHGKYGDATFLAAGVNTIGTVIADRLVTMLGTMLFGAYNVGAAIAHERNREIRQINREVNNFKKIPSPNHWRF